jgi:HD-GYP domain-containing protein (c-di-GMP phosphodiesterase class II)
MHQFGGREAATSLARGRRGKTLDPDIVDAFLRVSSRFSFWAGLEDESVWLRVREMEPESPYRYLRADRLDDVATAFADFADLKSMYSAGHSRRVAALAARTATQMALPPNHVTTIRRAALLHDLGLVAVPAFVLHKPSDRLAPAELDTLRLHPHHTERILARMPVFSPLCSIVAAHHERMDGNGYPRGLRGEQVPIGARVLAVADVFDELTHVRPEGPALPPQSALAALVAESGTRFDAAVLDALAQILDLPVAAAPQLNQAAKHEWPAGLTDREVEVLRVLSTGATRRDVAQRLNVSEHTVRHHLEHIYTKIDVRTRVEATLFALEHELVP